MPGYVIHLAEAGLILEQIKEKREISKEWEQRFLTGTLLPDTKLGQAKRSSHFWNSMYVDLLAQAPDLDQFLKRYQHRLEEPELLGYLAHLQLDRYYVYRYWPENFRFFNEKGKIDGRRSKISEVEVFKLGSRIPVADFFSGEYYYGDYTKLNGYFIHKYHLQMPEWQYSLDFQMDEVKVEDMQLICAELDRLLAQNKLGDEQQIRIFDLPKLELLLKQVAVYFIDAYIE